MTRHLGLRTWATGTILLAAVTACGNTKPEPTRSASPSVTASPSQNPPSKAAANASAATRHYFAVLDLARQSKTVPISRLTSAMVGIELATERRLVMRERHQGLRQTGATKIDALHVRSVNLDNSDPSGGRVPTVMIDVCWDVSKADLINATGKSVVSPSRRSRGWTRYTVANYHWATDPTHGWRIANGQDLKQAPCAGS